MLSNSSRYNEEMGNKRAKEGVGRHNPNTGREPEEGTEAEYF